MSKRTSLLENNSKTLYVTELSPDSVKIKEVAPVVHDDGRLGGVEGRVVVVENHPLQGTEVPAPEVSHSELLLLPEQGSFPAAITIGD